MTMQRAIAVLLLTAACTDAQPCTSNCPPVEGVWFLQYLAPELPCDGGTAAAPPTTVSFTRQGSVLKGAIDGIELNGTIYDSFDLTLHGQMIGGGETISVSAHYKAGATGDAGSDQLTDGRLSRETSGCRDSRRFTGARF
jgi:hypothetical protein